jgi:hypothetical protein
MYPEDETRGKLRFNGCDVAILIVSLVFRSEGRSML